MPYLSHNNLNLGADPDLAEVFYREGKRNIPMVLEPNCLGFKTETNAMKVKDLMTTEVKCCADQNTLNTVAQDDVGSRHRMRSGGRQGRSRHRNG